MSRNHAVESAKTGCLLSSRSHVRIVPGALNTEEAVRDHLAAFSAGDLDRLLDGFTEDAVFTTGTTVARGRDELHALFGGAIESFAPTLEIVSLVADGPLAACELVEELTEDGDLRAYAIAAFFVVRDGKIAQGKVYREGSAEV